MPNPKLENKAVKPEAKAPEVLRKASIDGPGVKCDRFEPGSPAEKQLRYYATCPKVRTRLPKGPGEKPGAFETVIVNGLRINILKGLSVDLPEPVAQIIEDAFYQTEKAIIETKIANPFSGQKKFARTDMQSEDDRAILNG